MHQKELKGRQLVLALVICKIGIGEERGSTQKTTRGIGHVIASLVGSKPILPALGQASEKQTLK